jgi:hypothetical protein
MTTKEKIKHKIDQMPNDILEKVYKYIDGLTPGKTTKRKFRTFKLKGQFDNINVRERAYE